MLNLVKEVCQANSDLSTSYALYDAVASAYQIYQNERGSIAGQSAGC
jgi:hypothetical protein